MRQSGGLSLAAADTGGNSSVFALPGKNANRALYRPPLKTATVIIQLRSLSYSFRNAFCKILYYQHILGDLIYDDRDTLNANTSLNNSEFQEKERGLIIAFAYEHPGNSNRDIFWELSDAFETLFANQKNSHKYLGLRPKLNSLAKEARALSALAGKMDAREFTQQRLAYEEQLLELLESYLPLLLDDEVFFRHAFPI